MKIPKVLLVVVLLVISLMLSAFVPAQAPTGGEVPAAVVALLPFLIGALGVPAVNALKAWLKWSDPIKNLWLTAGASLVLSILAMWLAGLIMPMTTPPDLQKFVFTAFGIATLIYKSWPEQLSPEPDPTPNPEANKPTSEGASPAEQAQK